jgi:hypothetical protein
MTSLLAREEVKLSSTVTDKDVVTYYLTIEKLELYQQALQLSTIMQNRLTDNTNAVQI